MVPQSFGPEKFLNSEGIIPFGIKTFLESKCVFLTFSFFITFNRCRMDYHTYMYD